MLGEHRVYPIRQVHRSSTLVTFFIQCCLRCYIMAYINNVHTYIVPSAIKVTDGYSIIKIPGINGVNSKGQDLTKVPPYLYFMFRNCLRQAGCFFQCIIAKGEREPTFGNE